MGARQKLNVAYVNGALVLAAILGWYCHSWSVFFVVAAIGIAVSVYLDQIRP